VTPPATALPRRATMAPTLLAVAIAAALVVLGITLSVAVDMTASDHRGITTLFLLGGGLFTVVGAVCDFDWFLGHRKARIFVAILGRNGTRVFYALLGGALAGAGAALLLA
jgi:hypothetical protein